jgi:hypothetical protein
MNRGRLRRYAVRVLAAAALGVALIATASGIANADTITGPTPNVVGRVVQQPAGVASGEEAVWS